VWRGCPLPHWGRGLGRGRAPSPEIFLIFYLKMVSFGAFWVALPRCMYTAQENEAGEEGRERALVKDDILH